MVRSEPSRRGEPGADAKWVAGHAFRTRHANSPNHSLTRVTLVRQVGRVFEALVPEARLRLAGRAERLEAREARRGRALGQRRRREARPARQLGVVREPHGRVRRVRAVAGEHLGRRGRVLRLAVVPVRRRVALQRRHR